MKNSVKFSLLHIILLSMTVIGLKNHVTILPPILDSAKRDGWMSVILGAVLILPWLFLLSFMNKNTQDQTFIEWLNNHLGKKVSIVLRVIIAVFLLLLCAFTLKELTQWGGTTFLPRTPAVLCLFIYIVLCTLLAIAGIQTLVIINVIVLFGVVVLGFFVAFVNIQVKDYELLRPFFEHGIQPILHGSIYPAAGYVELLIFFFVHHKVKSRIKFKHYFVMLLLLMGLTIGPLMGAITEFGPTEAAKQRYPAYEQWGLVYIGRFIEHLDFFSIYQWMTGAFIRISFLLYVASELLEIQNNDKKVWTFIATPFTIMCLLLLLLGDQAFLTLNGHFFLVFTLIFFFVLGIFLALLALKTKKSSKERKGLGLYVE